MARPDLLVSEDDRERCAETLARHYVSGRLSLEAFEARLDRARVGRTHGDLRAVTHDLPREPRKRMFGRWLDRIDRLLLRAHAATFLAINTLLIGVWALAGSHDFWPAWALVPTAVLLAWHAGGSWTVRHLVSPPRRG